MCGRCVWEWRATEAMASQALPHDWTPWLFLAGTVCWCPGLLLCYAFTFLCLRPLLAVIPSFPSVRVWISENVLSLVCFFSYTQFTLSLSHCLCKLLETKNNNDSCCIYPVCRLQLPKLELLKMIDILSIPAKTSSDGRFSLPLQQLQRVINDALQSLINYAFLSPWSQTWLA